MGKNVCGFLQASYSIFHRLLGRALLVGNGSVASSPCFHIHSPFFHSIPFKTIGCPQCDSWTCDCRLRTSSANGEKRRRFAFCCSLFITCSRFIFDAEEIRSSFIPQTTIIRRARPRNALIIFYFKK